MKAFAKRRSVCRALAPSVTTAIPVPALSVPNNNLIEELSAVCHNYRSHGCALTVRRKRVLNLREIRRRSGLKLDTMICVPRITIQSKRLWGVVKTGTVDCARLESRGETPRKLALRRYGNLYLPCTSVRLRARVLGPG